MSDNKKDFNTSFTLLDKKTNMQRIKYVKRQISELTTCYSHLHNGLFVELYESVDCWVVDTSKVDNKKIVILPKSLEVNRFITGLSIHTQHGLYLSSFKTHLTLKLGQYTVECHDSTSAIEFLNKQFTTETK